MIFTREMAEEIAEEFRGSDCEEKDYEIEVPGGLIFVDVTSRGQYETGDEDGDWTVGARVTFGNAVYCDDEDETEYPIEIEQDTVEFEYDGTDIDDWWPRAI